LALNICNNCSKHIYFAVYLISTKNHKSWPQQFIYLGTPSQIHIAGSHSTKNPLYHFQQLQTVTWVIIHLNSLFPVSDYLLHKKGRSVRLSVNGKWKKRRKETRNEETEGAMQRKISTKDKDNERYLQECLVNSSLQ
jgi:hypothetical protein